MGRKKNRLFEERTLRNWTLGQAAEHIGCSVNSLNRWEHGSVISAFYRAKLCEVYEASPETLGLYTPHANEILAGSDTDKQRRKLLLDTANMAAGMFTFAPQFYQSDLLDRLSSPHATAMNAKAFSHINRLLDSAWGLSNTGELVMAEEILMTFLPRMVQVAHEHQEAALLAAEGLRLYGILAAHSQRIEDKFRICLQAVEFARQSKDKNILVAQLTELAIAFIYAGQPANAFITYQEALTYCQQKEPLEALVAARIHASAACTYAKQGERQKAQTLIETAYATFPDQISEHNALAADNQLFMLDYYQGLLQLVLNQPEKAYDTFEQTITRSYDIPIPERWRLIIRNYQGLAAIQSNQLEQYAVCLEDGIAGSKTLGSQKRLDEAIYIYQKYLPQSWYSIHPIKQITKRFQLKQELERANQLEI